MRQPPQVHQNNTTLAVEYEDRSIHGITVNDLQSRIADDFVFLGLPRVSVHDIEMKTTGTFHIHLKSLSATHIDIVHALETGHGDLLHVKKSCGIERMWSLTRLYKPYPMTDRNMSEFTPLTLDIPDNNAQSNLQYRNMRSASPGSSHSGSSLPGLSTNSEDFNMSPDEMNLGLLSDLASSPASSVEDATKPLNYFPMRIQPLDQANLSSNPSPSPIRIDETRSVFTVPAPTQDPRLQRRASSTTSPLEESQHGYKMGTRIMRVQTDETHACGSDARLWPLLAREKLEDRERMAEVARERDELRMRVQFLEQEHRKACAELEKGRGRCRVLEKQMDDVRNECVQPFVVPALLDAFLKMEEFRDHRLED